MKKPPDFRDLSCAQCRNNSALGFDISMAFQPIVNINTGEVFAYESLVRGGLGQPASEVFERVNPNNLYSFDQTCRVKAVQMAAKLKIDCYLNINFMPNAVYVPELCIRTTLAAAREFNFPANQIIFELTEGEKIENLEHVKNIIHFYRSLGFKVALDDFGAGYSGLNLLADLHVDIVKLDMALIRNIDADAARRAIVNGIVHMARDLSIQIIAEGIETSTELSSLQDLGVELFQGYYLARPLFEGLPKINPNIALL